VIPGHADRYFRMMAMSQGDRFAMSLSDRSANG
jgi:hypothetical protein